jgi:uncharacterized protein (DUF2336 family)
MTLGISLRPGAAGIGRRSQMTASQSFLQELDEAVSRGSAESRAKALAYATDMLVVGLYTEDEIWIFGEVMGRLSDAIEVAVRAQLARRLATTANAPINVVKKLAFDDSIDVAGPILEHFERLDPETLVRNIRTKSQPHLLAISRRKSLPSVVTDELVTRGDREVATSVTANSGAAISDFGFVHLIKRAKSDPILFSQIGLRPDIPKPIFQQLIAKASADVRRKLEQERPDLAGEIQTSVAEVTGVLQSRFGYASAEKAVTARHRLGRLDENAIDNYARAHRIEETTIALALLCSLPVGAVEQAIADPELLLILAKANDFAWETAMSLLFLSAKDHRIKVSELDGLKDEFARLNMKTSQDVLSFYRSPRQAGPRDTLH